MYTSLEGVYFLCTHSIFHYHIFHIAAMCCLPLKTYNAKSTHFYRHDNMLNDETIIHFYIAVVGYMNGKL